MTIRLRLISEEDEKFLREIEIDSSCSFLDLHNFIQDDLDFEKGQMASFFITDENWEKNEEITLMDMKLDDSYTAYIMDETRLNDFITEPKQRLLYVFDFFNERNLFMEVYEIDKSTCSTVKCITSKGNAPEQLDILNLFGDDMNALPEDSIGRNEIEDLFDDYNDDQDDFDFSSDFENDSIISYTDNMDDL